MLDDPHSCGKGRDNHRGTPIGNDYDTPLRRSTCGETLYFLPRARVILDRKAWLARSESNRTGNGQGYQLHIRCAAPEPKKFVRNLFIGNACATFWPLLLPPRTLEGRTQQGRP